MGEHKHILTAQDLDGVLTPQDQHCLEVMNTLYGEAMEQMQKLSTTNHIQSAELIQKFNRMGDAMQDMIRDKDQIVVYPFKTPRVTHGEVSHLIAKLRDTNTQREEFVYYMQRAYELLFNLAFLSDTGYARNYLTVRTPVNVPVPHLAVHRIPHIDSKIENTVMCVMLRGSLLPSMIVSKAIQEYSSSAYVTPFALFRMKREETHNDLRYVLDLDKSFFDLDVLQDKDLIFADPMNATAGSLITVIRYLEQQKVRIRSVRFFNVLSSLQGSLIALRAIENITVYTLWMDPVLNEHSFILPGLGDAGDRLNGKDEEGLSRNIIQLIADYGTTISNLYRAQVRTIEQTVF